MRGKRAFGAVLVAVLFAASAPATVQAEQSEDQLRSAVQNPLADLISVPFQNNTDFGIGDHDRTKNTLNIQPVYPVGLGSWLLVNRVILPVVYQPDLADDSGGEWGLGDTTWSFFFAPPSKGVTWGFGPVALIPTSTKDETGAGEWGLGATAVALWQSPKWTVGALATNVWSINADEGNDVNLFTLQYFINRNLANAWYLTVAPINTANWEAPEGEEWTVPLGGGVGKIFRIGRLPVNGLAAAYYNVEKPEGAADWQLRLQLSLLFPKGK
jgi:hypothetical protein